MILEILLQQVPNQTLSVTINNDSYDLELNTRLDQLYMSIIKNNSPVVYSRICQNRNEVKEGFVFIAIDASYDPVFSQFNDRFKLVWTDEL
nr:MAG TPA: hypothetical protein [Caudoviricetes sp.]